MDISMNTEVCQLDIGNYSRKIVLKDLILILLYIITFIMMFITLTFKNFENHYNQQILNSILNNEQEELSDLCYNHIFEQIYFKKNNEFIDIFKSTIKILPNDKLSLREFCKNHPKDFKKLFNLLPQNIKEEIYLFIPQKTISKYQTSWLYNIARTIYIIFIKIFNSIRL